MKKFVYGVLGALGLAVLATFAMGQGQAILTTLLGTELVTVQNAGPLSPATTLNTIKTFIFNNPAGTGHTQPNLVHTGAWKPLAITDGTETTCVATTTYVAQIWVPVNMIVTGVAIVNATAVAGNVQVGLATGAGVPIAAAQSASTAASGTAAYQRIPFAAPYTAVGPATHYIQLQCNNTGQKFRTHTVGDFRTTSQTSGTYGTFVSFTLPTTFTTAVAPVASLY